MTMWKRERNHFNYYVTNERKQPHIYVEALGTPSASTEKVLKDHGFKFDYNKREPGLFSNGYIRYISIGRYAKKHLEKWDQKEKSKREKNRFNHTKREIEKIEKDL